MTDATEVTRSLRVYDETKGEIVTVSQETQLMAGHLHQQIMMGVLVSAVALKRMRDEKLYLGLGCQSMQEYLLTMCPVGRAQAYKYIRVADKFTGFLLPESVQSTGHSDGVQSTGQIEKIGFEKLYELTRIEEADFEDLREGKITSKDGRTMTVEEIREMTMKELMAEVSKWNLAKQKLTARNSQLEEDIKMLKSELDTAKAQIDDVEAERENARTLELEWGKRAQRNEDIAELINSAFTDLDGAMRKMFQIDGDPHYVQPSIQQRIMDFIQMVDGFYGNLKAEFADILLMQAGIEPVLKKDVKKLQREALEE